MCFLKKRTKKLLSVGLGARRCPRASMQIGKSFLFLFLKNEKLPS